MALCASRGSEIENHRVGAYLTMSVPLLGFWSVAMNSAGLTPPPLGGQGPFDQNGVFFIPPRDWVDRTMIAFSAPAPAGTKNAPNVVMTHEWMRDADSLRVHAERQLMELGRQLQGFDILESRETTLGGLEAIRMRFGWLSHFGALEQSLTMVERNVQGRRVATTFTTTAMADEAAAVETTFEAFLASVRFGAHHSDRVPAPSFTPSTLPPPPSHVEPIAPLVPMPGFRTPRR
jgi:hypothetical protein